MSVAYSLEHLDGRRWICLNRAPLVDVSAPAYDNLFAVAEHMVQAGDLDRLNWFLSGAVFAAWALVQQVEVADDPIEVLDRYIDGGPVPLAPFPATRTSRN